MCNKGNWSGERLWNFLVLSTQCFCKPKTALKTVNIFKYIIATLSPSQKLLIFSLKKGGFSSTYG
jgi:hypothetical protein